MHPSTEPPPDQTPTDAECDFAAKVLRELLHRIEVRNANAAAYPRPGRCTFLVSHAWKKIGQAYGLARRSRSDASTWGSGADGQIIGNSGNWQRHCRVTTKTKRDRHVPVPEPVWKRLEAELPADPNALVFPSRKGGFLPLGESAVFRTLGRG